MGQGGFRLLLAVGAILCALALAGPASPSTSCSSRLLADWQDGRIDRTYPVPCYRQALASMPEDVRVYSTAQTDITRALQARLGSARATAADREDRDGAALPLLVLAVTGGVLLAAGSLAAFVR